MQKSNGTKKEINVGIDLSTSATAVAIVDVISKKLIEAFLWVSGRKSKINNEFANKHSINTDIYTGDDSDKRLVAFNEWSRKIIEKLQLYDEIKDIRLEGYSFGIRSRSVSVLAEQCGIFKLNLLVNNLNFIIVPPKRMKKLLTGNGNSEKSAIALAVYKKMKVDFSPLGKAAEDLFDAIGLTLVKLK